VKRRKRAIRSCFRALFEGTLGSHVRNRDDVCPIWFAAMWSFITFTDTNRITCVKFTYSHSNMHAQTHMLNAVFQGNARCEEGADGPYQTGSERPSEGEEQRAVGSSASGGGAASSAPPPRLQPGILHPLPFLNAPCPHSYPYNASSPPSHAPFLFLPLLALSFI
jgi:hypothetical protein